MFDFNYNIKCWTIRKYNVEKFIKDNQILEKINELTIKNTVPRKIDKDGNVVEWYVKSNEELRQLQFLLQKLYNYVLYAYDKDILKKKNMTEQQRKALEDNENGIKSYIRPKRGKKTYYHEPKWTYVDEEIIEKNQKKQENFDKNNGKIIDKQVENYEKLKEEVKNMDKKQLEMMKINKQELLLNILYDEKVCNDAKESVNRIYISEGIRSRHDKLSDVDIEYNKKNIRIILNNWSGVISSAKNKPFSYIHAIYMDFDIAMRKVKLTNKQKYVLKNVLYNIPLKDGEYGHFDMIVEKFYKILNKK